MHLSLQKIFVILSLAFILGVFLGPVLPADYLIIFIMAIILFMVAVLFWKNKIVRIFALAGIFLLAGFLRFAISVPKINESNLQFYNGKGEFKIIGFISQEPDIRKDKTNLTINGEQIFINNQWQKVSGRVLVQIGRYPEYKYGDELEINGSLQIPVEFEDFSYKDYLSRFEIYSVIYKPEVKFLSAGKGDIVHEKLFALKDKFETVTDKTLPEPQASFMAGLIFGAKRGIPDDLMEAFNRTGTTHIIAISGFNITIIAVALQQVAKQLFLPKKLTFILAFLIILMFVIMTGASASVVRAAVMGVLGLIALNVERKGNITVALLFAGILMLLVNPKILRFDVGFQLSFLCTMGIIYVSPIFLSWIKKIPKILAEPLALTIAAQITATPIIIYNFQRLSLIAPLANILVLPLVPSAMFFGFLAGSIGIIFLPLGQVINWISWLFLTYIIFVIEKLSYLPFSSVDITKISAFWIIFYYLLLGVALIWWYKKPKEKEEQNV